MRLGFAIAAHLDADVLLLDEVFAVGDEAFQRKCFGKIFEFKQRGGTIVFVSHDATQVERLCERAVLLREGRVEFDGPTHEAIVRYRKVLAAEADPAERAAGLREWGTGEATIADARLVGAEGEERRQFLAGEPFSLRLRIEAENGIAPPRLQLELRDEAGLLVASDVLDTGRARLGRRQRGRCATTSTRLPLSDGRFHLRLGLADADGERLLHWLDDALASSSTRPARSAASSGWKGAGRRRRTCERAMSSRTCPDWPILMEIAPDLQFMHYTVAEAQLPVDVLTTIAHVSLGDVAICCDLEHHVFYAEHTDPQVAEALRATHWYEVQRVRRARPRHVGCLTGCRASLSIVCSARSISRGRWFCSSRCGPPRTSWSSRRLARRGVVWSSRVSADRLVSFEFADAIERQWAWIAAQASGDWLIWVDDDEIPSSGLLAELPALVAAEDVSHYQLRRRWVWPSPLETLADPPWEPEFVPRLIRLDPASSHSPGRSTCRCASPGPSGGSTRRCITSTSSQRGARQTREGSCLRAPSARASHRGTAPERGVLRARDADSTDDVGAGGRSGTA